jgi:hypothetical protein
MMDAMGTGALVKVVDVLGAEIEPVAQLPFGLCEGDVGCVRLRSEDIAAALGVEAPDEFGIDVPGFGRCDLLDAIAVPDPSGAPKGSKPALGGDAGTGEDEEAVMWGQVHDENETHIACEGEVVARKPA